MYINNTQKQSHVLLNLNDLICNLDFFKIIALEIYKSYKLMIDNYHQELKIIMPFFLFQILDNIWRRKMLTKFN